MKMLAALDLVYLEHSSSSSSSTSDQYSRQSISSFESFEYLRRATRSMCLVTVSVNKKYNTVFKVIMGIATRNNFKLNLFRL